MRHGEADRKRAGRDGHGPWRRRAEAEDNDTDSDSDDEENTMLGQLRDNVGKLQKQHEKSPRGGFACPVKSFKLKVDRIRAMCIAERLAGR